MNYYIQGNKDKADQIKAAFERNGIDTSANSNYGISNLFYYSYNGEVAVTQNGSIINIIKTHPDYKELELPVEPCFKVGDWIVANDIGIVSQITKVINDTDEYGEYHAYEHTNGYFAACFENEYHLWTIADAKDGDVLVTTTIRNCPFIYRKTSYKNNLAYYYAGIDGNGSFSEGCLKRTLCHFGSVSSVAPATKEQRDLIFAKMREAGYQWDADEKRLKKIQPHYDIKNFKPFDKVLVRQNDSSTWGVSFFGRYSGMFMCCSNVWFEQCIPFEGNEHLLGTTDMCDEQYINW